jgi:phosphoribosyl-ATP pyrophosphohydrolase/phosphoribosyl-AMP cyclohydrolase
MTGKVHWNEAGLVPAVVQDAVSGQVLMLGWMNEEALARTMESNRVHFWSRSRQTLWKKGETSGNELHLRSLTLDCDGDALLVHADPAGPTCHTGQQSCFFESLTASRNAPGATAAAELGPALGALTRIVRRRAASRPEGSYTAALLQAGTQRIAQKVGEEGVEVALAAAAGSTGEVVNESVDLLYHLLVLLESLGIEGRDVAAEITRRFPARRP